MTTYLYRQTQPEVERHLLELVGRWQEAVQFANRGMRSGTLEAEREAVKAWDALHRQLHRTTAKELARILHRYRSALADLDAKGQS